MRKKLSATDAGRVAGWISPDEGIGMWPRRISCAGGIFARYGTAKRTSEKEPLQPTPN